MLIRGIFYEGWQPTKTPRRAQGMDDFLSGISAAFSEVPDFDAAAGFQEFVSVLRMHVSEGEVEHLRKMMPDAIKPLWEDFSGFAAT